MHHPSTTRHQITQTFHHQRISLFFSTFFFFSAPPSILPPLLSDVDRSISILSSFPIDIFVQPISSSTAAPHRTALTSSPRTQRLTLHLTTGLTILRHLLSPLMRSTIYIDDASDNLILDASPSFLLCLAAVSSVRFDFLPSPSPPPLVSSLVLPIGVTSKVSRRDTPPTPPPS